MIEQSSWRIRPVASTDNAELAKVIRTVLIEMGVPKVGTAYADPELDTLFEAYQMKSATYFVLTDGDRLLGGAGVGPLPNEAVSVCELQKMYFLPEARSKGWGQKMIDTCLIQARALGYTRCYIETMPNMLAAQKLYQRNGFKYIEHPMGNTGHYSCPVWMLKDL